MLEVVAFVLAVVCIRMHLLPTMLGVVALVLAVVCVRLQQLPTMSAQHCWELLRSCIPLQQLPTMLRPAVHHGMDTTHKTLETMYNARAWPQQCWKSSALRVGDHGTEEMLGFVSSKV